MTILIFFIVSYILLSISLMKVFEMAGVEGWKALVPGLNFMVWAKLVGHKSPAYAALLLIPIVNIFIYAGLCVDLVRSFGKYKFWHSALAVIYAPIMFFLLGNKEEEKYIGPTLDDEQSYFTKMQEAEAAGKARALKKLQANNPYKKSAAREWTEAIVFAVFAAAFIRMFLIEAYTIPTTSMEGALKAGDFLFVSKWHYGIRTPKTVAMIPLLHNRIPALNKESYLENPNIPMYRLPAYETVDRNDPVVFNFPAGDSVYVFPERTWTVEDYRYNSVGYAHHQRAIKDGKAPLVTRPVDKRDHYIKRCIAVGGDSLEIRDRQVFINGEPGYLPEKMQFSYTVSAQKGLNPKIFDDLKVNLSPTEGIWNARENRGIMQLNQEQFEALKAIEGVSVNLTPQSSRNPYRLFPNDPKISGTWTVDNFGPIWVPKKGETVEISADNIAYYRRVINIYEDNDLEVKDGKVFINGAEANEYTFKMNYYWMMGDNRHNSEDSRVWGFVPEDHVVGKPLFIWFSTKHGNMGNGINWDRIFTWVSNLK
ncbi:MAG: signal peptidase I [Bacteroidetes bacterium]|jgi:signal peptidase I|nr:signal peptidase I [Bacteroidota bacterium]MDF1867203.1 signal peptidase I [Saprospiraceae bacterium]